MGVGHVPARNRKADFSEPPVFRIGGLAAGCGRKFRKPGKTAGGRIGPVSAPQALPLEQVADWRSGCIVRRGPGLRSGTPRPGDPHPKTVRHPQRQLRHRPAAVGQLAPRPGQTARLSLKLQRRNLRL